MYSLLGRDRMTPLNSKDTNMEADLLIMGHNYRHSLNVYISKQKSFKIYDIQQFNGNVNP